MKRYTKQNLDLLQGAARRIIILGGGQSKLARLLNINQAAVWCWAHKTGVTDRYEKPVYDLFRDHFNTPITLDMINPVKYAPGTILAQRNPLWES